jgi:gamma-glutamylputrescine oxidase
LEAQGSSRRHVLKTAALVAAGGLASGGTINVVSPSVLSARKDFDANVSHWSKALPAANASLDHDLEADIVVIGGGFTGLSSAFYLRKVLPGKRVVLLEAERCGNGASGRNGAMVLTMSDDRYMRLSGDPQTDRRLYDLTSQNIRALQTLSAELGIDCELDRNGALQVLNDGQDLEDAKEFVARSQEAGFPFELWVRERTAAAIGTTAYLGALFDPGSGQVHPGKLVALWKAAAAAAGAEIYDGTPVANIDEGPIHRIVTAAGHTIRAPILVLATNAYSSRLGYLRGTVAPISDYVAITPVLTEAQLETAGWKLAIPFNDSRTEVHYAGLTRDRRIHFGGGHVDYVFNDGTYDQSQATARHAGIRREFARVFPSLADVDFETVWGGAVDMSLDGSPAVGRMGRNGNIFYGIGYSGHGVNMTSIFGRVIADLVAGHHEQWSWLPFLNRLPPYIPNEPFRWLAVRAGITYTRLTES